MAEAKWYIVHAYSNFEKKVAQAIRDQAAMKGLEEMIEDLEVPTEEVVEVVREELERASGNPAGVDAVPDEDAVHLLDAGRKEAYDETLRQADIAGTAFANAPRVLRCRTGVCWICASRAPWTVCPGRAGSTSS